MIRVACFLLIIVGLATSTLFLLKISLPLLIIFQRHCQFSSLYVLLKRLRWLLLSLLILYGWFSTPTFNWLPDPDTTLLAFERIASLIMILLSAHLLRTLTPTQDLVAALQWWLHPGDRLGLISSERLSVRLVLTLETVQTVQALYQQLPPVTPSKNWLTKVTAQLTNLFIMVLNQAETTPLSVWTVPELQRPPFRQWVWPILIIGLYYYP